MPAFLHALQQVLVHSIGPAQCACLRLDGRETAVGTEVVLKSVCHEVAGTATNVDGDDDVACLKIGRVETISHLSQPVNDVPQSALWFRRKRCHGETSLLHRLEHSAAGIRSPHLWNADADVRHDVLQNVFANLHQGGRQT